MRYALFLLMAISTAALAENPQNLVETRYCGLPERYQDGTIKRSAAVVAAFKREHPCPSTGLSVGRCDGWQVDHIVPLASCGCDAVWNMQWLPVQIKTCGGLYCKDRWEREVYQCPSN